MADNTGDLVLFWDGKEYAAQYLDKALPGLTERVKHSEALVEKWPSLQMRSANWVFAVIAAVGIACSVPALAIWGISVVVYGMSAVKGLEPVIPPLVFGGITLLLACLSWPLACLQFSIFRPTITVQGGIVCVTSGSDPLAVFSVPICQCCWFFGWVNDTVLTHQGPLGPARHRAIVVQFPKQSRFTVRRRIAVGLTAEMHAIWEAFLTIAEVPQIARQERGSSHGFYGRPERINSMWSAQKKFGSSAYSP